MDKEEYYNIVKRFVYRKFNELEVSTRNDVDVIYLHYTNMEYAKARIRINSGEVYYVNKFRNKIIKPINLEKGDFDILLSRWIEDTFQIKVNDTISAVSAFPEGLKMPTK